MIAGPEDVRANRAGRLTDAQTASLGGQARRSRIRRTVEFGFCAVVALLAAMLVFSYPRVAVVDLVVPIAIGGLGALVFRPWTDPLGADIRAGRVEVIVGPVNAPNADLLRGIAWAVLGAVANSWWVGRPDNQLVAIGPGRFIVPDGWATSLVSLSNVRGYYLPRSRTLLSFELAAPYGQAYATTS